MDLNKYTEEMSKSIWDKAFFMDKIQGAKCVIDFGCADGAMIRFLAKLFPETMFVGYDISEELIKMAQSATPFMANTIFFCGNKVGVKHVIEFVEDKYQPEEICLNFSSVLHEVFSSSPSGKEAIQTLVNELEPKYITIRDMYFDYDKHFVKLSFANSIIDKLKIDRACIDEFEKRYGTIMNWENLIHFLMKYQWKDNGWEQEMEENYFSWWLGDFIYLVGDCYEEIFKANYQLPYYTEQWMPLFFKPEIHTHAQFVLRRND